ncbi:glycosyltransferase family 2 protein [Anaerosacchariphilus polymeriproducens]|uniref:Glycosyltransferase family 2 protein n=1 Tax=Anaerosacchariphilus polymeriproducens TaxID=1812858 RepID=A0A371AY03_9FIRM|nr:glycosyltransferase family 2 protein [Anaerosacchariphilus polymeriproducens]RDU24429.1 glycosyltransferase family 2 protein [Anaerosacchariphilus polymeriproducens]
MLVNILLSTYNGEKYLLEQLESINRQTYPNIHLYIRDDGSSDGTLSILENFSSKYPISIMKGQNIGFMKSFFELLSIADSGDYWAFCDQDDVWLPHKISLSVDWLKKQNNQIPLLFQSAYEIVDENLIHKQDYLPPNYNIDFRRSITENWYSGFSCVINNVSRDLLLKGKPDNIDYHDWWMEMIAKAFGISYFDSTISAQYRRSSESLTRISFSKKIKWFFENFKKESDIRQRALEFERIFFRDLSLEHRTILSLFTKERYQLLTSLKKACYPKRWRPDFASEISMRLLMLLGKI